MTSIKPPGASNWEGTAGAGVHCIIILGLGSTSTLSRQFEYLLPNPWRKLSAKFIVPWKNVHPCPWRSTSGRENLTGPARPQRLYLQSGSNTKSQIYQSLILFARFCLWRPDWPDSTRLSWSFTQIISQQTARFYLYCHINRKRHPLN